MSNMTKGMTMFDCRISKKQLLKKDIKLKGFEQSNSDKTFESSDCERYKEKQLLAGARRIFATDGSRFWYLELVLNKTKLLGLVMGFPFIEINPEQEFLSLLKAGVFDKVTCDELNFWPRKTFLYSKICKKFERYIYKFYKTSYDKFYKTEDLPCHGHILLYFFCCGETLKKHGIRPLKRENRFLVNSISKLCQKSQKHNFRQGMILRLLSAREIDEKSVRPIKTKFPIGKFIDLSKCTKLLSFQISPFVTQPEKQRECKKNEHPQLISRTSNLQDKCLNSDLKLKNQTLVEKNPGATSNMLIKYKLNIRKIMKAGMANKSLHKLKYLEINDIKPKFNDSVFSIYLFELTEKCARPLFIEKIVIDLPEFLEVSSSKITAIETWPIKSDECGKSEFLPFISTLSELQDEYLYWDSYTEKPALTVEENLNESLKRFRKNEQSLCQIGRDGIYTRNPNGLERLIIEQLEPDFNYSPFWLGDILFPKHVECKNCELVSPVSPILTLQAICLDLFLRLEKSALLKDKNPYASSNDFTWNELNIQKVIDVSSYTINSDIVNGEQPVNETKPSSNDSNAKNCFLQQDEILPLKFEDELVKVPVIPPSLLSSEDKIIRPNSPRASLRDKGSLKNICSEIKSYDSEIDFSQDSQPAFTCSPTCTFENCCEHCDVFQNQFLIDLNSAIPKQTSSGILCVCGQEGKLYFDCGHYSCFECFLDNNCVAVCHLCKSSGLLEYHYLYDQKKCVEKILLLDWWNKKVWTSKQNETEIDMLSASFMDYKDSRFLDFVCVQS